MIHQPLGATISSRPLSQHASPSPWKEGTSQAGIKGCPRRQSIQLHRTSRSPAKSRAPDDQLPGPALPAPTPGRPILRKLYQETLSVNDRGLELLSFLLPREVCACRGSKYRELRPEVPDTMHAGAHAHAPQSP